MKRCVGHLKLTFQALRFSQLSVRVGPSSPKRSQAKRGETRKPNGTLKLTFQALRFSQLSMRVGPSSPKRSQAKRGETRKPNGTND